jgi:hypothetical protein
MNRSSKSQDKGKPAGTRQATAPRKQQGQQIPRRNLMGPAGDPAEGRRDSGPKGKR